MLPYNIEFFRNNMGQLEYVHRDMASHIVIDDDYISGNTSSLEIGSTELVKNGDYIYIRNDEVNFFGVVADVAPGEYKTQISYRPFITVFDEDFLFDTHRQGTRSTAVSLEQTLVDYLTSLYVNPSDPYQKLPITVSTDIPTAQQTTRWSLNLTPDTAGDHYTIIGLYTVLIVNSLKKYGVAIRVRPSITQKKVILTVTKSSQRLNIDGDLDNVTVKTLKYNERPTGVNKLTVYNTENYSVSVDFFVHTDRTFSVDETQNRITPVVRDVKGTQPDSDVSDPSTAFAVAALDVAYSVFSGIEWDNLIELETFISDDNIRPMSMEIGQTIKLWYKGGTYQSILTGKTIGTDGITLLFGSERIQYSKRYNKVWRKNQNA